MGVTSFLSFFAGVKSEKVSWNETLTRLRRLRLVSTSDKGEGLLGLVGKDLCN